MRFPFFKALSLSAVLFSASLTQAAVVTITQWGFNLNQSLNVGTGTFNNANVSGVGSTTTTSTGLALLPSGVYPASAFGSSADTAVASTSNGYATMNSAQPTDASGQGVQFRVSTASKTDISVSWDFRPGARASKYWQMMYTADGTTWQAVPAGGTASIASLGDYTGSTVTNGGLLTVVAPSTLNGTTALGTTTGWMQGLSYSFPTGGAWENSATFGIALYQIYNPNSTGTADVGYVSATSGLNSTDATTGYLRGSASGGTQRFDLVTVSGVPEPTSIAAISLVGLTALRRRRSH